MRNLYKIILAMIVSLCMGWGQVRNARMDSTFTQYSLPQLQNFRNYYNQELDRLQEEKRNLIRRGIQDGELQLASNPDPELVDQILIRLADLYYYHEKDDYLSRMEKFDQLLEAYDEGTIQELPDEPRLDFEKSLSTYQRIIDEFPHSDLIDDAVYNKGFLLEEMGQIEQAVQVYQYFVGAYPKSKFIPDAYMRLGEYYFNPPVNSLQKAIGCYKIVTQYQNHSRYDESLYKLGWSYYRLSEYPEAISYFTSLIENLYAQQVHLTSQDMRTDLLDEAIEYIAISFIDYGGPSKLNQYLRRLQWPAWTVDVLRRMGNAYKEQKEDYPLAIQTYQYLIEQLGDDPETLFIRKAIVDCYVALDDKKNIFTARENIYKQFHPRSSWWQSIDDEKTKLDAYRISENALRNNFNTVLQSVTENPSQEGFENVVSLGYQYLDTFPEDNYAYMIRWNVALILDTKLSSYKEALQEYLTISLVYSTESYESFAREKGLSSIKDAAQNAIVIADTLVAQEKRSQTASDVVAVTSAEHDLKEPVPLTEAQKWKAMAYDNYIKLFPFDEKTPAILSNAGALYYINNHFDEAIKYFKTLMKYFPNHQAVKEVELSILESYFAKRDYESTEALAKKILSSSYPVDVKEKARQRLGEAIFLKAQGIADTGNSVKAADEFYRLALEAPKIQFADRALFNAAAEYEKVHDYESAIRAYEMLRTTYSASDLLIDGLNNLAFDYSEIGKNRLAGDRYRELSGHIADSQNSQDALHNAYICYVKGRHWLQAIEAANAFVSKYPQAEEAEIMYYQIADHYQQLNQPSRRASHLISFIWRFPQSLLSIEASYELGRYYQHIDSLDNAEKYYKQTYTLYQKLPSDSADTYAFMATEGLFNATRIAHRKYEKIQFNVPPSRISTQAAHKQRQLEDLENRYAQIVAMKTIRLPESLYRIAELYDQYAVAWAKQPIAEKDPGAKAVKEKQINERTAQIFNQALDAYLTASKGLRQLNNESSGRPAGESDISDSLAVLTRMWTEKSEVKISATLFRMAQIYQESIERLLSVPLPAGLSVLEGLEYRSQLLIQAIQPLTKQVIAAHQRNLQVADSLFVSNSWTQASNKQILINLNLVGEQYEQLSFDALHTFDKQAAVFRYRSLEKKQKMNQTVVNNMVNLIELSKTYALAAVQFCKQGMQQAEQMGLDMLPVSAHREAMDRFALNLADSLAQDIKKSQHDQRRADAFLEATQEIMYEDMLTVFEDIEYYLNIERIAVLETAFETEPGFQYQRQTRNQLAAALLRIDPETYSKKWGIQLAIKHLATDTTWTCSFQPVAVLGNETDEKAVEVNPHGKAVRDSIWSSNRPVYQIWVMPAKQISMLAFRKSMQIPGVPVQAEIHVHSESPCRIYVNGTMAVERAENGVYDIVDYLNSGLNQIGFIYKNQKVYSVRGWLTVRYIPKAL
ncbi:tetratricopeptide repeat protein [bacterium]|nr:tetratricopeptide repeat protein [bacterium]